MSEGAASAAAGGDGGNTGQQGQGDSVISRAAQGIQSDSGEESASEVVAEQPKKTEKSEEKSEEQKEMRKLYQQMKDLYPEGWKDPEGNVRTFESDDDYMDAAEHYVTRNREANERLTQIFNDNPDLGKIIRELDKKMPFAAALARHVDVDGIKPQEGDPDYEAYQKAYEERKKELTAQEEKKKNFDANIKASQQVISEFATENKWDQAKASEFLTKVDGIISDVNDGKLSKDFLAMMQKALSFDEAVEDAKKETELKVKNEKIEAEKAKEKPKGDGIPKIESSGDDVPESNKNKSLISQIASDYEARQSKFK